MSFNLSQLITARYLSLHICSRVYSYGHDRYDISCIKILIARRPNTIYDLNICTANAFGISSGMIMPEETFFYILHLKLFNDLQICRDG